MGENVCIPCKETKGVVKNTMGRRLDVYIWDMDETLILLKSLLNGTYADTFNGSKDVQKGVEIGKMWEKHILDLCDDYFFYEQIENYNKPFLDALIQYDDGKDLSGYNFDQDGFGPPYDDDNKRKLAYRHRDIAQKYEKGLHKFFDQEKMKVWDELYNITDKYTDRWLSSARAFLDECSSGNKDATCSVASADGTIDSPDSKDQHVNILVTSGSLIPSLVKCLLFRLDSVLTHGNGHSSSLLVPLKYKLGHLLLVFCLIVYSSWDVGKLQCFQWIKERFSSSNVRFCVIGDGWEECEAAQAMTWPFVKIDLQPGCSHRFPGLTPRTVGYYFSVVYGSPDAENDED